MALIRDAFAGVTLGSGVGLLQAQGIDDYAGPAALAERRERDEKDNWSAIPAADLDRNYSSLSFFDADGMRFHLPAYLVATLERRLRTADVTFHLAYFSDGSESRYFRTLTKAQRHAIREFLMLILADPNQEFVHSTVKNALDGFWSTRNDP